LIFVCFACVLFDGAKMSPQMKATKKKEGFNPAFATA
jgi:hypothetical protein